ncbi:hypothetical protein Hanom_Chr10g00964431 [Helianthus anomalus]
MSSQGLDYKPLRKTTKLLLLLPLDKVRKAFHETTIFFFIFLGPVLNPIQPL